MVFTIPYLVFAWSLIGAVRSSPPRCDSVSYSTPATTPTSPSAAFTTPAGAQTMPTPVQNTGWWCATEQAAGQSVTAWTTPDVCLCVGFGYNKTASELMGVCAAMGGTLVVINSAQENTIIGDLVNQAYAQDPTGPQYMLYMGLQKFGLNHQWNDGCNTPAPVYTNYNQTGESNAALNTVYMYSSDGTWTPNNDPANGTANGYICEKKRNPCGELKCNATQTCVLYGSNCAYCQDPTTTAAETTTHTAAPGISNPVPYCNSSAPAGGWWCARDYPMGQQVATANASDSCFCYMYKNMTHDEAEASCAAQGGYLSDVRNAAENTLLLNLVNLVMKNSPEVQLA